MLQNIFTIDMSEKIFFDGNGNGFFFMMTFHEIVMLFDYTLFAFLNETFESFRTPGLVPPEIFKSSLKNIAVPSSSTSQFLTTFLLNIINPIYAKNEG